MDQLMFHPELVLRVVELSDVAEIAVLTEIPQFNVYIEKYKTSIVKEKQSTFLLPAGWAKTDVVITHHPILVPAHRSICFIPKTEVSFIDTWAAIGVMKERDAEINSLLYTSSYLRLCPDVKPGSGITWPLLDGKSVSKLRTILRRAMYICDAIYDIEAQTVIAQNMCIPLYNYTPRAPYPLTREQAETWPDSCRNPHWRAHLQNTLCTQTIPRQARERQFKFVQCLCDADLLALWALCYLASESYHEWRSTAFHGDMDTAVHKERAFKHCILSYGSYFLYGHVRGNGARSRHKTELWDTVLVDFWSDHPRSPPGSLAALNSSLMRRFEVPIVEVDSTMLNLLIEVLEVDKKAFDDPPSVTVWGA